MTINSSTNQSLINNFFLLFGCAFFIRAAIFIWFIQPGQYYQQPDSIDYHNCALSMALGTGMHRPDTLEPIFWRTPGYPLYLAIFYNWFGIRYVDFPNNTYAQHTAIWGQIFLSSFIPCIILLLALVITNSFPLALIASWITVFHSGFVLASNYILTEGIALIFFYLFLLFLCKLLILHKEKISFFWLVSCALMLGVYTWIRPMGECVAIIAALILILFMQTSFKKRMYNGLLFFLIFFATISPWYIRNFNLTGELFFCPTIGTYFNCFCVPKILRRTLKFPIEDCLKIAQQSAAKEAYKKKLALHGTGKFVSPAICKKVSLPIVMQYPWFFFIDWTKEVIKTTFDLYASQLVSIANGTFFYDPIEEFLGEKIKACLYTQPMPFAMRLPCWIELFYAILLWIGLFYGFWIFVIKKIIHLKNSNAESKQNLALWIACILICIAVIAPTGGFGYARLRLPIEPILIILSLASWFRLGTDLKIDRHAKVR
jgi:hypothetical protein